MNTPTALDDRILSALEHFLELAIQEGDTEAFDKLVKLRLRIQAQQLARERFEFVVSQAEKKQKEPRQKSSQNTTPSDSPEMSYKEKVQAFRTQLWGKEQADAALESLQRAEKEFAAQASASLLKGGAHGPHRVGVPPPGMPPTA